MKKYVQTSTDWHIKEKGLHRKTGTALSLLYPESNQSLSDVRKALHS